jgi:hypothetical protein
VDPNNLPGIIDDIAGGAIGDYERGWSVAQVFDIPDQITAGEGEGWQAAPAAAALAAAVV